MHLVKSTSLKGEFFHDNFQQLVIEVLSSGPLWDLDKNVTSWIPTMAFHYGSSDTLPSVSKANSEKPRTD